MQNRLIAMIWTVCIIAVASLLYGIPNETVRQETRAVEPPMTFEDLCRKEGLKCRVHRDGNILTVTAIKPLVEYRGETSMFHAGLEYSHVFDNERTRSMYVAPSIGWWWDSGKDIQVSAPKNARSR